MSKNAGKETGDTYHLLPLIVDRPVPTRGRADGSSRLVESHFLAKYLDNTKPDSGPKLFPRDPMQLFKVTEEAKAELDQGLRVITQAISHYSW